MAGVVRAAAQAASAAANHGTVAGTNNTLGNATGTTTVRGTTCTFGQAAGNVGFFGTAGTARPTAYTQTYATATRSHAALTSADVDTTPAGLAIFGYTQAQADSIPVAINALRADLANVKQLLNAVIDDLQALGLAQ